MTGDGMASSSTMGGSGVPTRVASMREKLVRALAGALASSQFARSASAGGVNTGADGDWWMGSAKENESRGAEDEDEVAAPSEA
jgi:hypothetical protein